MTNWPLTRWEEASEHWNFRGDKFTTIQRQRTNTTHVSYRWVAGRRASSWSCSAAPCAASSSVTRPRQRSSARRCSRSACTWSTWVSCGASVPCSASCSCRWWARSATGVGPASAAVARSYCCCPSASQSASSPSPTARRSASCSATSTACMLRRR